MPSVISKYWDDTLQRHGVPREVVGRVVVGAAVVAYGAKLTYPHVRRYLDERNKKGAGDAEDEEEQRNNNVPVKRKSHGQLRGDVRKLHRVNRDFLLQVSASWGY
jgi:hypothetical protein